MSAHTFYLIDKYTPAARHCTVIWTGNMWHKNSKKVDVEGMTGRHMCIAYPIGQGSKLMLFRG